VSTHRLDPEVFFTTMGPHPPALRVRPADTVVMQTLDAVGCDREGVARGERPNPQSGPVWVEGAEPGDALEVRIVRLTPSGETGWSRFPVAANVVEPERANRLPERDTVRWAIDLEAEVARLLDPPSSLAGLTLPLDPMIGCFGVAPGGGAAISTSTPGSHGGNMDWRGFRAGTTVWFPVSVPGGLFFAGDGHAAGRGGDLRHRDRDADGDGIEVRPAPGVAHPLAARRDGWRRAVHRG
jgi:acetamidase/formamidase